MSSISKLFQPAKVGNLELSNRVVHAPLTRFRANGAHVPTDLMVEYYKQRASYPGTLLISEATYIAPQASGMFNAPGIWSEEQIAAWKKVTDAVHAAGSYIYMQLWALGRVARVAVLKQESPDYPYVSASPIALSMSPNDVPRELTKDEIKQYVEWYGTAARNAVLGAGFDGVEVHGANGYLVDQFLQDVSNTRTDEYGGSVENRARFALEVIDAIVAAVGAKRTAIRLSPFNGYHDMGMKNPVPQFTYVLEQFKQKHPDLAYIHTITPDAPMSAMPEDKSVDPNFIYKLWSPRTVVTAGSYVRESAIKVAEETNQLVGFGRPFIANPDLVYRLRENIPLNEPQEDTFYLPMSERGYTTYPFSEQFLKSQ
ncbi:NADH:flavin oxidoreductase/NADH oxidase [Lentinus tigrinus ALCF2SS1-7]|uniref:NADH:flavin oxidoreductase/NADH oxidase n=1 Tax=Lentinus tigrinus ALCF2SS1-7 TaxID=1328758 RepID=UPI0011663FA6|nr:NADH:flavin oxidoreductase/NADH oxidase [Lentinus tigrinus ALCF2SS1-7]